MGLKNGGIADTLASPVCVLVHHFANKVIQLLGLRTREQAIEATLDWKDKEGLSEEETFELRSDDKDDSRQRKQALQRYWDRNELSIFEVQKAQIRPVWQVMRFEEIHER